MNLILVTSSNYPDNNMISLHINPHRIWSPCKIYAELWRDLWKLLMDQITLKAIIDLNCVGDGKDCGW